MRDEAPRDGCRVPQRCGEGRTNIRPSRRATSAVGSMPRIYCSSAMRRLRRAAVKASVYVASDARSSNAPQRPFPSVVVRVSEQTLPGGTRKHVDAEQSERRCAGTVEES